MVTGLNAKHKVIFLVKYVNASEREAWKEASDVIN